MTLMGPRIDPTEDPCAREPIRIPGGVQPHGCLLVLAEDLTILQASENLGDWLHLSWPAPASAALSDAVGPSIAAELGEWAGAGEPAFVRTFEIRERLLQITAHRTPQGLIVEFERGPAEEGESLEGLSPRLRAFVETIGEVESVADICQATARTVRAASGFDRVLVYRFQEDWVGEVVAEDGNGVLPSYMGQRFPASDIPAQARELYRLNRLRLIATANYAPARILPPLSPVDGQPLDLSPAALRSVSPVHLQYMRNMGTLASMSISIVADGRLWGLVSCHSANPRLVNPQVRTACDFLGQILSLQIGLRERAASAARRIELKAVESELLARLAAAGGIARGLADRPDALMRLTDATGAAALIEGEVIRIGQTPDEETLLDLAAWMQGRGDDEAVFVTDNLGEAWPPARRLTDVAAGLLSVSVSQIHAHYIFWFRPEVVRTVQWAGDPRKAPTETGQMNPRLSFEAWKEEVRGRAQRWSHEEIASAEDFRGAVTDYILRRAEERAALTAELQKSNKELESFSYSVSHDLRAPFRHIVGYAELLSERETALDATSRHYLDSIIEAALGAGRLVDDLLNFSHLGRTALSKHRVDMNKLLSEVRRTYAPSIEDRQVEWRIGDLPPAWGDAGLIRQALANLVDNALKYSRGRDPAVITIDGADDGDRTTYTVSDNGVGFDQAYVGKLFGVFQRLHRSEDFEGTGIGLALVGRVVDRHGGETTAQGVVDGGATFRFSLPKHPSETAIA